jgi:hypothetical protein
MKTKILLTILFFIFMCNTSIITYSKNINLYTIQDTLKPIISIDTINIILLYSEQPDSIRTAILEKEINPIQIDTTHKIIRNFSYKKLEKTETIIKEQQKIIDSLLFIRKTKITHHQK